LRQFVKLKILWKFTLTVEVQCSEII
jgi:hypothetical protein